MDVDSTRLVAGISDRHVEIMRRERAAILHDVTGDDVEYVFGDGVRSLAQDGGGVEVTVERGVPRRFDLVVGADGRISTVVVGAYLLAAALRRVCGDHARAFDQSEDTMSELVTSSRRIGPTTMKTLIPATQRQVWLTIQAMRVVPRLPATVQRRLFAFQGGPATALDSVTLPDGQ